MIIEDTAGKSLNQLMGRDDLDPRYQIDHAERIGLGTKDYKFIELE